MVENHATTVSPNLSASSNEHRLKIGSAGWLIGVSIIDGENLNLHVNGNYSVELPIVISQQGLGNCSAW